MLSFKSPFVIPPPPPPSHCPLLPLGFVTMGKGEVSFVRQEERTGEDVSSVLEK